MFPSFLQLRLPRLVSEEREESGSRKGVALEASRRRRRAFWYCGDPHGGLDPQAGSC